jgi:hypothetical protein
MNELHESFFVAVSGLYETLSNIASIQAFHRNDIFKAKKKAGIWSASYAYFYTYEARSNELFEQTMMSNLMLGDTTFEKVLKRVD